RSARIQTDTTRRQAGTVGAEPREIAGDRAKRETEADASDPISRGGYTFGIAHGFGASGAGSTGAASAVASCSADANTSVIRDAASCGLGNCFAVTKPPSDADCARGPNCCARTGDLQKAASDIRRKKPPSLRRFRRGNRGRGGIRLPDIPSQPAPDFLFAKVDLSREWRRLC